MRDSKKCPKCGSDFFTEYAMERTGQGCVQIEEGGNVSYELASRVEPVGNTSGETSYECSDCGTELYLVDKELTDKKPKAESTDLVAKLLYACQAMVDVFACDAGELNCIKAAREAIAMAENGKKLQVIIEVAGGVADVTSCPKGVEVEIIDHD